MPTRPMAYDDARDLLREAEADLAAVRSWPDDRPGKFDWQRAVEGRLGSLRKLASRLAAGQAAGKREGDAVLAGGVFEQTFERR